MSNAVTTTGTCIAFAAAAPADPKGVTEYAALTWTASNEVTNFGDIGPEFGLITFETVCDGIVNKRPGAANYGSQQLTIAFDADNAAQEILRIASDNRDKISVRFTLATGDIYYYEAYVTMFKTQTGGTSDYIRASVTLELDGAYEFDNAA